jgi:succinyl-diaminopimelate desuccinylase
VMRATIQTTGRSVHATNPDRGVNAITAMAKIVLALEQYHHELAARAHPLVGAPTCNVGVIEGGSTANAVPDRCTIRIDRRMVPREDPAAVQDELRAVVAAASTPEAPASVGDFLYSHWFESGIASPLAQTFLACAGAVLPGGAAAVGYAPGSDAKHLMTLRRGEMIIFGPGSYEVAHAADEYVTVDDLAATTEILRRFVTAALFG